MTIDAANEHQQFEADWWGDCANTYGEETKQLTYARLMGLEATNAGGHFPVYEKYARVADLGGGPVSILLKCHGLSRGCMVVDPCPYPRWVFERYAAHGILQEFRTAESWAPQTRFDECWIYNVLQHVEDPERVITSAKRAAPLIRIFDWLDTPPSLGHPHTLRRVDLEQWLGQTGQVAVLNGENGCYGVAFHGVFRR